MRVVYRALEVLGEDSFVECVVKRIKSDVGDSSEANFAEAKTQSVAESYAQDFNRACTANDLSHRIAFLPVSVVQLEGTGELLCLEPYLPGEYVKHSDNNGHNETEDEVAAAFSYFTYVNSNGLLVVCDIQGVGTFYTDPQIHTFDGRGFGLGNIGANGIRRFLRSHRHNLLCEKLGLPSLDAQLTDEELAQKIQAEEREDYEREARAQALVEAEALAAAQHGRRQYARYVQVPAPVPQQQLLLPNQQLVGVPRPLYGQPQVLPGAQPAQHMVWAPRMAQSHWPVFR
jgi:hypothetical protein